MNITTEQGKTLKDAQGDVFRGLGKLKINFFLFVYLCFRLPYLAATRSVKCCRDRYITAVIVIPEVVEHACGMATLQMGEYISNVSNGIDTYSIREPLGVCAGICPFNFPAMIPLWVGRCALKFYKFHCTLGLVHL